MAAELALVPSTADEAMVTLNYFLNAVEHRS